MTTGQKLLSLVVVLVLTIQTAALALAWTDIATLDRLRGTQQGQIARLERLVLPPTPVPSPTPRKAP